MSNLSKLNPPTWRRSWLASHLMLGAVIALLGCEEAAVTQTDIARPIKPAVIGYLKAPESTLINQFVGKIDAAQTVDLAFEVPGQLAALTPREGDQIAQGALIARLDQTPFEIQVREASAQFELAQLDFKRKQSLLKDNAISPALVDQASAQLDLVRAHLDMSRRQLKETELRAPFNGLLSRRFVDNHTFVGAGQAIVRFSDLSEVFVRITVPERLVGALNQQQILRLWAILPDTGESIPLALKEFSGEANPVAQSYMVTLVMPATQNMRLLPGMNITVFAERALMDQHPLVPIEAVHEAPGGGFYVWRFSSATGAVSPQSIKTGEIRGAQIEVVEGLTPGDAFVAAGGHQLRDGMVVRPMPADARK